MKISFLFPSKSRPTRFFATLDNLQEMCVTDDWEVTAILDRTDDLMNTGEVFVKCTTYPKLNAIYTDTISKVHAMNEGLKYLSKDYDILVLIADDIVFTMKGFDSFIVTDMQQSFPKFSGLLHYPDGNTQGLHQITMPVIGRRWVNHFKYIFHPSYDATWCDKELMEAAKRLKKYKFINRYLFVHNHPAFGKGENDALYKKNQLTYQQDSDNYFKRLAINFEL